MGPNCCCMAVINLSLLAVFGGYVDEEPGDLHGGEVTVAHICLGQPEILLERMVGGIKDRSLLLRFK